MPRSFHPRLLTTGPLLFAWPCLLVVLATGCASTRHLTDAEGFYRTGQYTLAAQTVRDVLPDDDVKRDRPSHLLDNLYLGSSEFMAGKPDEAGKAFAHAIRAMDEQDARLLGFGGAYQGKTYDDIMANTYRALSLWMDGDPDRARVAFRLTAEAQEHAAERNARQIRKLRDEEQRQLRNASDRGSVSSTVRSAMRNGANAQALALFQRDVAEWGCYDSFENPASHFLDAVFTLANREGPSDLEHGSFASRKALAMTPSLPAKSIFDLTEALADGRMAESELDDVLVVIFENGLGPTLVEKRFDLIIPFEDEYYYVGMALPQLIKRTGAYPGLVLHDGDRVLGSTSEICDFNRIVTTSYRQALPGIISAEVLRCSMKVVMQAAANHAIREEYGDGSALFASLAGSLVAQSMTNADTRLWKMLPYDFQAAVTRKPASGVLSISPAGGVAPVAQVTIPRKGLSVVYVKIPAAGLPPLCRLLGPNRTLDK